MAIVDRLITRIETSKPGSSIKSVLKSGTEVEVVKGKTLNTVKVIRKRKNGCIITTLLKKVKDMYMLKKVKEEHRFGVINIDYKSDGSRVVQIRTCDKTGRNSRANTGFYKTTMEENIFAKGVKINSPEEELKFPRNERSADILFLIHLKQMRKNERYKLPTENYTLKQDFMYEEHDLKNCKQYN
ncbi:TPA: hypothetical protein CPT81_03935 [Candidatus Gastranaerophilales bacterium HUM_20]|nr:unknown [Clostridium sp. CAG:729]DAB22220.1 MAG TPA: hypothetical protein CPT81_03935 [Candidatus Gastranaerophilales bacterium HUM_20]